MKKTFIQQLGFEGFLIGAKDIPSIYPDYKDIIKIGVDSAYFSAGKPAVLFLNVISFDEENLKKISAVQHNA